MPSRSLTGSTPAICPVDATVPEVGSIIRLIIRSEVVLPLPEGPTNTVSVAVGDVHVQVVDAG